MPRPPIGQGLWDVERELVKIPNVGPAMARDLLLLGVRSVEDLATREPAAMYAELCALTQKKQDPCVLDTLEAIVHYARTGEARPWWSFTAARRAIRSRVVEPPAPQRGGRDSRDR